MPRARTKKIMQEHHAILHKALRELIQCFTLETGQLPEETLMSDFEAWAEDMREHPTCVNSKPDRVPRENMTHIAARLRVPPPSKL